MRPPFLRSAFLAAAVVASLVVPARVEAGGAVVPLDGRSDPSSLDVRVAISVSPSSTTRWSEVTVPPYTSLLWLVPARPGATVAWGSNTWLSALEEATAPRISQPSYAPYCDVFTAPERTPSWTVTASKQPAAPFTVHTTVDSVRAAASSKKFTIGADLDARIASLYADGWNLVAVELPSTIGSSTSNTIRISDDGGAALPLALVGSQATDTRVTAYVIANGVMGTSGGVDLDGDKLRWGASGSDFVTWRRNLLQTGGGDRWLRESASHAALFDGTPVIGGTPTMSVAAQYLGGTSCATSAKNAGGSDAVVGESLPSSTFACGDLTDLAVALDGLAPRTAVVTRWSGLVTRGKLGVDRPITFDASASQSFPSIRAGSYAPCATQPGSSSGSGSGPPLGPGPTGGTSDEEVVVEEPAVVYVGDGCGGGTTTTTTYEEEEETTTTTSDDGCGSDTTTTSSSSDEGWDTSDDSGDSCSSDSSDSSSSSSDSCSSGSSSSSSSSSSGSDDGWDTEDNMSPKSKKTSLKTQSRRGKSPVSRFALFAFALILPLRRRARAALERR